MEFKQSHITYILIITLLFFAQTGKFVNAKNTNPEKKENFIANAVKNFYSAKKANPESPYNRLAMSETYMVQGNIQKAYQELIKANDLAPNNPDVLFSFAKFYYAKEDFENSLKYIKKSLAMSKNKVNTEKYMLSGIIYEKLADLNQAVYCYKKVLEGNPSQQYAKNRVFELEKEL